MNEIETNNEVTNATHLFIDKPKQVTLYAVMFFALMFLGFMLSLVKFHGWLFVLLPLALIILPTIAQEIIHKIKPKAEVPQIIITAVKYGSVIVCMLVYTFGFASGAMCDKTTSHIFHVFYIFPIVDGICAGLISILFGGGLISELYHIMNKEKITAKRKFLFIDKPKVILSNSAYVLTATILQACIMPYSAGMYFGSIFLLIYATLIVWWWICTILQELAFVVVHNRVVHISADALKWGPCIVWTVICPIVFLGSFVDLAVEIVVRSLLIALSITCCVFEIIIIMKTKKKAKAKTVRNKEKYGLKAVPTESATHLFIDKPKFIAVYAVAVLSAVPIGLLISYVRIHGWALMLPPFAVVAALTFIQERIYKKTPQEGIIQTVITTIKYVFATAWCVYCICGLSIGFLHEENLRFAFEYIPYISAALVGVLALLFVLACVIEIYYIRKRSEEIKRRQFLLIDKPRVIISELAFIAALTALVTWIYNGLSISSAGSFPMIICNPAIGTWFTFTVLQELLFLRSENLKLHIALSSVKWGLIMICFIVAAIIGGALYILAMFLIGLPIFGICALCLCMELSVMKKLQAKECEENNNDEIV